MINILLNLLNREHYQTYQAPIAHYLKSVEAAILFAEFIQRHQFHEDRKEIIEIPGKGSGWFYHTKENIEERTAINRYGQDKAMAVLKEFKLIDTIQFGMPCKKYLRLNFEGFEELSKNLSRKSTVDRQVSSPSTDKSAHLRPTDSLYIEEPNKEPNKEREELTAPPPTRPKKKPDKKIPIPKTAYRENIFLTDSEHQKLLAQYGQEKLEWMLDYMEAKKGSKDYAYKSDYHVLLPSNWVNQAFEEQKNVKGAPLKNQVKEDSILAQKIWDRYKARIEKDISLSANYLEFINGYNAPSVVLEFGSKDFRIKCLDQLRNRRLKTDGF